MKIRVRGKNAEATFECDPGERILYAGLRNGVGLPYECATGTCGNCKARARPGTIRDLWAEAPGHAYLKAERGEFLMCQAVAGESCEIEVPAKLADRCAAAILPSYNQGGLLRVERLAPDVASFEVALARPLDFHAGQFVALRAPGIEGHRAYSMVNYQRRARRLKFVVKKKPGGAFSEWLLGGDRAGARLDLFGPMGKAIFRADEDKHLLCIAGGSGIAGIMAILAHAIEVRHFARRRARVFFGVRTMADAFFLDELAAAAAAFPGAVRVTVALSDENAPPTPPRPGLEMATGFVHAVAAESMAGAYDDTIAFVAGPPPMVDGALRMLILDARLPAADIRYDKFS